MSLEFLSQFAWLLDFAFLIKLFSLALVFFYFIFCLVVTRQVALMNQILETSLTPLVKIVILVQTIAVACLFFLILIFA